MHVAFFAQRVGLTPEQVRATQHGTGADPIWSAEEWRRQIAAPLPSA